MNQNLDKAVHDAMAAGAAVRGTTSPNPPVGAVILNDAGETVGVGATQPVGGAHAEVMALQAAGEAARGGTAVVTLEPCDHTGNTGPCTQALIDAGIKHVFYLHADPNPDAAGGADTLRAAGVEVTQLEVPHGVEDALIPWLSALRWGRPHVTLKFAQTLDGFTAAVDGSSKWITGERAREWVHQDRSHRDAIVIGTGTALADNPSLTARRPDGELFDAQPRRVVIGKRDVSAGPATENLQNLGFEQYHSIEEALGVLYDSGARDILVEGGAGLASAFINAGYVDLIQAYIAPVLLGEGRSVLAHPLAQTLNDAPRFRRVRALELGDDILVEYVHAPEES
ncbi:Riboflavin biosynthesis protein RibD [Corynebacterium camporealensis]|uniref:Riboflavin biosynthesis protein RibD n=1 Tax=Corynebacterium camporealensis TaxID=161896 RepID=A0A0F6TAQ5_9CORY|nr:bifunctional diaminohydroxyphosphoribosylaminopyrimidine deaminase/5-amino-6-(5-phosphoribosylamino)uracil reductase RibD [Corynebacterium camporealensis]AKE39231.1 riboflavin biosynthesis protein RibD [Corynebacterium camporealensis]AVH88423.1 Riboflavin biosynthesis protein RibD [Corynebacterium camporealensis]MDY5839956.1 bifunctional diaminohydroxyphosphoribosylaminopyrimidine deaminase/5-amino-6-(5-phosphoribosylamino)uracil reductase RibD [Corynebacterium camporealensis]